MKKGQGFTLIELLAVIVILAIILAIAIPSISGIIENARKNAFENSVKLIIKAIDNKKISDNDFDVTTINVSNIDDELNIGNGNYESITVTIVDSKINVDVVGQNRWDDLSACGTYQNITVNGVCSTVVTAPSLVTFAPENNDIVYGIGASSTNIVAVGRTYLRGATLYNYDINENYLWDKSITGTNGFAQFRDVVAVSDGYVAVGRSSTTDGDFLGYNNGDYDGIIVKFDLNGNVVWKDNFGGTGIDQFMEIIAVSDGLVVVGLSKSTDVDVAGLNNGGQDGIIVKYNNSGSLVWKDNFGGTGDYESFYNIIEVSDGYIVVGEMTSADGDLVSIYKGGDADGVIVKYDFNGNVVWKKTIGGTQYDYLIDIEEITGGYVMVGGIASTDGDFSGYSGLGMGDAFIIKTDTSGNILDYDGYGGSDDEWYEGLVVVDNKAYAIGMSYSMDGDLTATAEVKNILTSFDSDLNMLDADIYDSETGDDVFHDIIYANGKLCIAFEPYREPN